ncbi:acyl carrier protein [Streptomyces sp. NPDC096323]|uniref:acyl carrier protein n=1 Tax=Streptomyces sp. NPDC096323 TaxID=3155822 RepID=UPI00331A9180
MIATTYPGLVTFIAERAEVPVETVVPDRPLEVLELDSLTMVEIVLFIQREYGIDVPEGDLRLGQTPAEWFTYLDGRAGR